MQHRVSSVFSACTWTPSFPSCHPRPKLVSVTYARFKTLPCVCEYQESAYHRSWRLRFIPMPILHVSRAPPNDDDQSNTSSYCERAENDFYKKTRIQLVLAASVLCCHSTQYLAMFITRGRWCSTHPRPRPFALTSRLSHPHTLIFVPSSSLERRPRLNSRHFRPRRRTCSLHMQHLLAAEMLPGELIGRLVQHEREAAAQMRRR